LTAWLADIAKHNNRNKQNKSSSLRRRNIAFKPLFRPIHAPKPFLCSKLTLKPKTPRKQAKTAKFSGVGFLFDFFVVASSSVNKTRCQGLPIGNQLAGA
jgi:hypothetical protein